MVATEIKRDSSDWRFELEGIENELSLLSAVLREGTACLDIEPETAADILYSVVQHLNRIRADMEQQDAEELLNYTSEKLKFREYKRII